MLIFRQGSIFDFDENVIIAHQVNCQGVMGSGVAKQVKSLYPIAYQKYLELTNSFKGNREDLLGKSQVVRVTGSKDVYISNIFGQLNYGYDGRTYTNVEALLNGLEKTFEYARLYDVKVVIPYKIGCDRGGADWSLVLPQIEELASRYEITCIVSKF